MNTVTEAGIRARIVDEKYFVIEGTTVTICHLTLENGFSVRGESACVDPLNFDKKKGEMYAFDNAFDKLWMLEGYLLCDRLWREKTNVEVNLRPLEPGSFGFALEQLKKGNKASRAGWNGKGMWLSLSCNGTRQVKAENFWSPHNADFARENGGEATVLPTITMKTATGEILMGWLASQTDMLANDWVVV